MDLPYAEYAHLFEVMFSGNYSDDEIKACRDQCRLDDYDPKDLSIADYVWLPITFRGDRVTIDWRDEWKIEDWDDVD